MWIRFESSHRFAIKVHLGGVNAISGEPMIENAATRLRRLSLLANKKSIQDYVVTPEQLWLDGIASENGRVRQFVAMPLGSGYSVETQVTGQDLVGGLQFEITPAEPSSLMPLRCKINKIKADPDAKFPGISVYIKTLTRKTIALRDISPTTTVYSIKDILHCKEGIFPDQQRLIYSGKQLEDGKFL